MKFTSQEEYGLRCLLHLARIEPARGEPTADERRSTAVKVADVAEHEGVSEPYVSRLFRLLVTAGLVESVRGRGGGFRLARPPAEITVAETLAALGGRLYEPSTCERFRGNQRFCVHSNDCSIRSLWSGIQILLDQVLSRTSLSDLVGEEKTMAQWMEHQVSALPEGLPGSQQGSELHQRSALVQPERVVPGSAPESSEG